MFREPPRTFQGWVMFFGLCGIPVTALVARFVIPAAPWGWRLVFVWGALGIIFRYWRGRSKNRRAGSSDAVQFCGSGRSA